MARVTEVRQYQGQSNWSVFHNPAASAQATISKALVAGKKHVCTSISATLSAVAAQTLIQLNLRDGATGAGAIIWSDQVVLPIGAVYRLNLSGLDISGSLGTAMTLEFSGAPVTTNVESVAMTGYDVDG